MFKYMAFKVLDISPSSIVSFFKIIKNNKVEIVLLAAVLHQ